MARDERAMARKVLRPTTQAAVTTEAYTVGTFGARDLTELAAELEAQTRAVSTGDLSRGEAMLTAQAHTLDAVFNKMARHGLHQSNGDILEAGASGSESNQNYMGGSVPDAESCRVHEADQHCPQPADQQ